MSDTLAFEFAPLRLKKDEDRRLRAGHLWVYSNEVDTARTPLTDLQPGQPVLIESHQGKALGSGYVNPHSLICARLVSRDHAHPYGPSLLVHRLKVALGLRERLYERPFYRLVHGDADGLPGLVVDRFDGVLVAQLGTAGMEAVRDHVLAALDKVLQPRGLLWRNDHPVRELEKLDSYVETALGEVPQTIELSEGAARFAVPLSGGQKTGWYFDQRDNRVRLARYVRGARVLDLFSYVGAWGIQAALAGAREVICADSSGPALALAANNAALNDVADRVSTVHQDALTLLKALRAQRERFDLVVVDPPAFIKRRKDFKEGALAYRRLNEAAMQVLARDGLLVSCSCSHHFSRDDLVRAVQSGARHLERFVQILEQGHQGPDHPVHPAIPETDYLKVLYARVLPA